MIWLMIIVAVLIVVIAIVAIKSAKIQRKEIERTGKYPEGHFVGMWMGIGIAIFSGAGVAISTSSGNPGLIGIGPALGVAFGLSVGTGIEKKMKEQGKIRPLTEKEKQAKSRAVLIGILLLILGIAAFLAMLLI